MATPDPSASAILEAANKIFFDQIKSADQKAAYILTVALALTITSDVARNAFKLSTYATRDTLSYHTGIAHVALILLTLIFAILVVFPRFRKGGSVLYWGAWPEAAQRFALSSADKPFDTNAEYIESNKALAHICRKKFNYLRTSFILLIISCLTHTVLLSEAP